MQVKEVVNSHENRYNEQRFSNISSRLEVRIASRSLFSSNLNIIPMTGVLLRLELKSKSAEQSYNKHIYINLNNIKSIIRSLELGYNAFQSHENLVSK